MIKRLLRIIIIIFICSFINVYSLTRSELTVLNLNSITTIDKPEGYTSVQGGTTTDKYIITLFINEAEHSDGKCAIMVLNKKNYKLVRLIKNPITEYDFGHANDATFNINTNELIILSGRKLNFLDLNNDSFKLVKEVELKKYYHGVGYDSINDQYVLSRTIKGGTEFEIRDSNFNIIRKFKIKTNLTKQSLTVYQGNIYYVCYEAGMLTKYQSIYDGLLKRKENLIYVYDLEGNKKTIYYIPFSYKEIIFGEIENIAFSNGKMLIQFNHANKAGYFTAEYKKEVNAKLNINVDKEHRKEEYTIYENEKEYLRVKPMNNNISIDLRFTNEGMYTYKVKPTLEKDINDYKDIEIEVYYDPVINKLKTRSTSEELEVSNEYLYDIKEIKKRKEEVPISPPNTNTSNGTYPLAFIPLTLGISCLKNKES